MKLHVGLAMILFITYWGASFQFGWSSPKSIMVDEIFCRFAKVFGFTFAFCPLPLFPVNARFNISVLESLVNLDHFTPLLDSIAVTLEAPLVIDRLGQAIDDLGFKIQLSHLPNRHHVVREIREYSMENDLVQANITNYYLAAANTFHLITLLNGRTSELFADASLTATDDTQSLVRFFTIILPAALDRILTHCHAVQDLLTEMIHLDWNILNIIGVQENRLHKIRNLMGEDVERINQDKQRIVVNRDIYVQLHLYLGGRESDMGLMGRKIDTLKYVDSMWPFIRRQLQLNLDLISADLQNLKQIKNSVGLAFGSGDHGNGNITENRDGNGEKRGRIQLEELKSLASVDVKGLQQAAKELQRKTEIANKRDKQINDDWFKRRKEDAARRPKIVFS